jgi:hypothetical protein
MWAENGGDVVNHAEVQRQFLSRTTFPKTIKKSVQPRQLSTAPTLENTTLMDCE